MHIRNGPVLHAVTRENTADIHYLPSVQIISGNCAAYKRNNGLCLSINITHISIEMFLFLKFSKFKTLLVWIPTVYNSTYLYVFPDPRWLYIALIFQIVTAFF